MSYEGYEEFICEKGHYHTSDALYESYVEQTKNCPQCGGKMEWWNSVDQTNGYYAEDPSTFEAPKKEVGFEDVWAEDHYKNKYAIKVPLFSPESPRWRKLL